MERQQRFGQAREVETLGIEERREDRLERLVDLGRAARDAGRLSKFVPASGAATRMFRALLALRERRPGATLA
ncbi:MAG TPA: DUF4301 family protein, partial [Thermoanaerobaculia bacterium]|nr:DUF4301 family protein [Thermoanaerobaculia bacterium]